MRKFKVASKNSGVRLDIYLAEKYPQFTRSSLEDLFERGHVAVNGEFEKPSHKIKAGDRVEVNEELLRAEPPVIVLPVIYEDNDVIVLDKPEGILTHSKGTLNLEGSVASFIKTRLNDDKLSGNRAGIVHRLDRATSGVVITAKNTEALHRLQRQFSLRKAKKSYLAVIEGHLEPDTAMIDAPISRNPKRPQTFHAVASGKPAKTEYHTLKIFHKNGHEYSLLELKPLTGRTHQLRVHLAYLGHPIVGDRVYGKPAEHLMLHAARLEITLPNSERRSFEADPPPYFKEFVDD